MSAASATTAQDIQRYLDRAWERHEAESDPEPEAPRRAPIDSPLVTLGVAVLILVLSWASLQAIQVIADIVAVAR